MDHCFNDPCLNNGTCINSADGYRCNCPAGFKKSNCEGGWQRVKKHKLFRKKTTTTATTTTTKQHWKQRQKQQHLNYSIPEWPSFCLTGMGDYKSASEQARNLQGVWSWCSFLPFNSRPSLADLGFFKLISFCFPSSLKAIYALATYSDIHWANLWQKK